MDHRSLTDLSRKISRAPKVRLQSILTSFKMRCYFLLRVKPSGGFATNHVWLKRTPSAHGFRFSVTSLGELQRVLQAHRKEPMTQRWIETMPKGSCLWDIGANIGVFSFLAASRGIRVLAIETLPSNVIALNRTLLANPHVASNVTVIPIALAQTDGIKSLLASSWVAASSGAQVVEYPIADDQGPDQCPSQAPGVTMLTLTGDTLQTFLGGAKGTPNFIKLDVDGNELEILHGLHSVLSSQSVESLLVETQDSDHRRNIEAFLNNLGFVTRSEDMEPTVLADPDRGSWNLIFRRLG